MKTESYKSGYLEVGHGHELYYELYGNPKLKPILFIHGGPGAGFTEKQKELFDSKKFNIIFYDQRGAGKSKPYLSLENNTTAELVEDIEKLLDFLDVEKVILLGGSWGATLGLLYAIEYPHRVDGMVLTGMFLATKAEAESFVNGSVQNAFPEAWKKFVSLVPKDERNDIAGYYIKKILHGSDADREKYSFNWALYDVSISTGETSEEKLTEAVRSLSYQSLALFTAHYIKNRFFIPEGYVLDNIQKVEGIPVAIVQSKADAVTPPTSAIELHKHLKKSSLDLIEDTHSGTGIKEKMIQKASDFV